MSLFGKLFFHFFSVGQRTHTRDDVLRLLLENKAVESNQIRVLLLILIVSGNTIWK